ncbi:MAG TPA: hypothetical protein VN903_12190 [Polyangia bacterium]|nr:hypothetical protein [Polyangia bacterium]
MTATVLLMAIALAETTAAVPVPATTTAPHWRGLVVVLVPPIDDDVMRNALARVSGELAAAPFKTVTTPLLPDGDIMAQVETAGSDQAATAAFAIMRDREPGSDRVTIWVSNRVTGTTTMQRMQVQGGGNVDRAAARLAVETVELVRASLADLWPAPAPPTPPPETVEKPAPPRPSRLRLAVSVGQVRDFGDAPAVWLPQIAATYGNPARVGVRLSVSGLGPGAGVSSSDGSAHVDRAMVTLGLVHSFRSDQAVQPMLGLAAGVHYVGAHGTAAASMQPAYDKSGVSALGTASAGVAVALSQRVAVMVEADLMMMTPTVAVRIVDRVVATIDNPSLFTHAGLLASF